MLGHERGKRDGWNVEQRPFERGGDRAGVRDVVAEVGAEVDAGDDDVGALVVEKLEHAEVHAVGGRAVDDPLVGFELQQAQWAVERQRVRGRALLAIRRDDDHLAERRECLGQFADAFAVDAVVVGDEDADHWARW